MQPGPASFNSTLNPRTFPSHCVSGPKSTISSSAGISPVTVFAAASQFTCTVSSRLPYSATDSSDKQTAIPRPRAANSDRSNENADAAPSNFLSFPMFTSAPQPPAHQPPTSSPTSTTQPPEARFLLLRLRRATYVERNLVILREAEDLLFVLAGDTISAPILSVNRSPTHSAR
jgi:hypothetical protein